MNPSAASADLQRIARAPRVELGAWPTPVTESTLPDGRRVLVKEDVRSGWGRGGAKTRKVEHLIGHLLAREQDELITVAGNVTNLAFDLLPALDRFGVAATLFIQDDPPVAEADRERIFREIRDRVHLVGRNRSRTLARLLASYGASLRRGRRPFLLLPGASHPAAVMGNARGFLEMARQLEEEGRLRPDTVFVTAATGTTVAGFLIADEALRRADGRGTRIVGVQVYPGAIRERTLAMIRWTERHYRLSGTVPGNRIRIRRAFLHGGFAAFSRELAELCRRVEASGGPSLDPIFGGKTWGAMERWASRRPSLEGPLLYWHCGYTPEWQTLGRMARESAAPSS